MRTAIVSAIIVLVPIGASADSLEAKIDAGRNATSHLCAPCHTVTGSASSGAAPSFSTIAATRNENELRQFLAKPHPQGAAPAVAVAPFTNDDIVAYIESLKK